MTVGGYAWVGEWVEVWSCTGQEYLYIFIIQKLLRGSVETLALNGMTGCWGGRGWGGKGKGGRGRVGGGGLLRLRRPSILLDSAANTHKKWGQVPCSRSTKTQLQTHLRGRHTDGRTATSIMKSWGGQSLGLHPDPNQLQTHWFCCHESIVASLLLPVHPAWPQHHS